MYFSLYCNIFTDFLVFSPDSVKIYQYCQRRGIHTKKPRQTLLSSLLDSSKLSTAVLSSASAWTCSTDMQHEYGAWTCNIDMQHGHAAWTCIRSMQHGHSACRHAAPTCSMDIQQGHAVWRCSKIMQHVHEHVRTRTLHKYTRTRTCKTSFSYAKLTSRKIFIRNKILPPHGHGVRIADG